MSQSLPQWCLGAMAEAGVSPEGWAFDLGTRSVEYTGHADCVSVTPALGHDGKYFVQVEGEAYEGVPAFRLASRLAAALEGKPCPKCAELRAENERLRGGISKARESADSVMRGLHPWNSATADEICRLLDETLDPSRTLSPTEQETQETQENEPK